MDALRARTLILALASLFTAACSSSKPELERVPDISVVTVQPKDLTLTQQYVGQIEAHHFIKIRSPISGILGAIPITSGQLVEQYDLLFEVLLANTSDKQGDEDKNRAFSIKAPFEGVVDRVPYQKGSFVKQGETLTTLSDNSQMWVYFNVPESRYLDFMASDQEQQKENVRVELNLANGKKFEQVGKLTTIEAGFNASTGSIRFRADFPNPDRLLRHGQNGNVLISRIQKDALMIPQRVTFERDNKRYLYVVDKDDVAHQRQIIVEHELGEEFVVKSGINTDDKIVVKGMYFVRDGGKVKINDNPSQKVVANLNRPSK